MIDKEKIKLKNKNQTLKYYKSLLNKDGELTQQENNKIAEMYCVYRGINFKNYFIFREKRFGKNQFYIQRNNFKDVFSYINAINFIYEKTLSKDKKATKYRKEIEPHIKSIKNMYDEHVVVHHVYDFDIMWRDYENCENYQKDYKTFLDFHLDKAELMVLTKNEHKWIHRGPLKYKLRYKQYNFNNINIDKNFSYNSGSEKNNIKEILYIEESYDDFWS